MVFFYDLHAALTLTSVPTAVFILLHLTVCLQLCIFYVSTVHAAVCIHPTRGRLFKDFFVRASLSPLEVQEKQRQRIPRCVRLGRELLHPGPLWPLWHFSWTWTECFGDTIAASTPLNVSRWPHNTLFFFFFYIFHCVSQKVKMERWTAAAELSRWNLNRRMCSWFELSFSNSSPYRCHYNLGTDASPEDITVLQSL